MPAPIFYDGMPGAEIRRALNEWTAYVGDAAMPAESVTSLTVGNGTKVLTVPEGRAYGVGQPVRISRTSDPSIWMGAVVTDYTGTQLTVEVETHDGSGTYSDWTIVLSGGAGPQGIPGEISDLTIGTVQEGAAPDVSITGTAPNQILNFTLEKGDKGDTGPANSLSIGNVQSGSSADASITGTAPSQTLNLTLPKGDAGDEVELQKTATHIQWRYTGGAWTNLVLLDDLKGEKGDEVEMQVTGTHIQWRYTGGSWVNLVPLSTLKGDKGDKGDGGWTPVTAVATDGARRVLQITDWTGGDGTKPATGYMGPSGIVATKAAAVDIRGPAGTGDVNSVNSELPDGTGNVALEISHIPGLADAIAAAGQVKTVAGVLPDGVGDVPLEVVNISGLPTALSGKQDAASGMGLSANDYTTTEKDKLAGIAAGATANDTDINLKTRSNHIGTQPASTVSGLATVATSGSYSDLSGRPDIPPVVKPTNLSPADETVDVIAVNFTGSPFYSLYGKAQKSRQARMSLVLDFATTLWDSGEVMGAGVTVTGPDLNGLIPVSTTAYWQIRYRDIDDVWSEWSDITEFTTVAQYLPTVIGQPFGGGFYAGDIKVGADTYCLITAPKSAVASLAWKTTNVSTPGTSSTSDGLSNSNAMNNSAHPAAKYCRDYRGGGFDDWYLPAKSEREIEYRAFKPDATANNTSSGTNPDSVPTRGAYTAGDPPQTAIAAFKTGGAEAFAADNYWTSTEDSATSAWRQSFGNGYQNSFSKGGVVSVRPGRRVKI